MYIYERTYEPRNSVVLNPQSNIYIIYSQVWLKISDSILN